MNLLVGSHDLVFFYRTRNNENQPHIAGLIAGLCSVAGRIAGQQTYCWYDYWWVLLVWLLVFGL
jgi:hypothetical protein